MTPNEHLQAAEGLLALADQWGPSSESSARVATTATAHVHLALAKVARHAGKGAGFGTAAWEVET